MEKMEALQGMSMSEFDQELLDALFKLDFKLPNGKRVVGTFHPDTQIDYENLEDQLADTPAKYAFWSAILSEQKYKVAAVEKSISRRRAILTDQMVTKGNSEGVKIHKYLLDELIEADDKMFELSMKLIKEQRILGKLWTAVNALQMKSEHLRSLAGFKKQELRDSS